jgi:hypothetical protein
MDTKSEQRPVIHFLLFERSTGEEIFRHVGNIDPENANSSTTVFHWIPKSRITVSSSETEEDDEGNIHVKKVLRFELFVDTIQFIYYE